MRPKPDHRARLTSPEEDRDTARRLFRSGWEQLSEHERDVIEGALQKMALARDPNQEVQRQQTFGERASDALAAFGGSWTFILLFAVIIVAWALLNTEILGPRHDAFDPYPYVFLNLVLSMLAALQAPVIMMSQNRQARRDRIEASIDHEVNVRADIGIRSVDQRLKEMQEQTSEILHLLREPDARR